MLFQKNTLKFYIIQIFAFLLSFFLIVNAMLGFFLRMKVTEYNQEEMYAIEKLLYNGFENLNTVIRSAEKIIRDNGAFFQNYSETGGSEEMVRIVQLAKEMMTYNTYIEDVVFYKVGNDRLITTKGTIDKRDFFNYAYFNEDTGIEFWDEIMLKYNTPTIIPLSSYTDPFESAKRLFVVPKIYALYDVGVLLFVNEQNFLSFSGLSSDELHAKIRLYDDKGYLVLSNANDAVNSKLNIDELQKKPVITKNRIYGSYSCLKWFDYENSIFSFEKWNPLMMGFFIYMLVFFVAVCGAGVYFIKIAGKKAGLFGGNDKRIGYPILLTSAIDSEYYLSNRQLSDSVLMAKEGASYAICCLFSNQNALTQEEARQAGRLGKIFYWNSSICMMLIAFRDDEGRQRQISKIAEYSSQHGFRFAEGESFAGIEKLNKAARSMYMNIGTYELKGQEAGGRNVLIPSNFRSSVTKLVASKNRTGLKKYLTGIVDENIKAGLAFDCLYYLLFHLYYELAEVTAVADKKEIFEPIDVMFYTGLKTNYFNFDMGRMKNVFFNVLNAFMDEAEKGENRLDKREIIRFLESNYRNNIYMEQVAEHYQMTGKYFSYYFKKEFGIGFNEYLTQLRLEEGKRLLLKTDLSVNEISKKSGYANPATFIVAFKKYCGETPGQFRKDNL